MLVWECPRAHKCRMACPLGRRKDSLMCVGAPHVPCPRRSAAPLWVGRIRDEVLSPSILRPPCSVPSVAAIREYGHANALRARTSNEEAFGARAKLFVDVGVGMLSSTRLSECTLSSPETRFAKPSLTFPIFADHLPLSRRLVTKMSASQRG